MNDKEIREAIEWVNHPHTGNISDKMREVLDKVFLPLATLYLNASEFPKEKELPAVYDTHPNYKYESGRFDGFNEARSQCLAVHLAVVSEKDETIEKLQKQLESNADSILENNQLLKKVGELEAEIKRLQFFANGYGNAKIQISFPTDNDPFNNIECKIIDFSHSENSYIVEAKEIAKLKEEIIISDKLIEERNRILKEFDCPQHGDCVPFVIEQIKKLKEENEELVNKALDNWGGYMASQEENEKLHQQIEGLRGMLDKLCRAVRNYADIGIKTFNQDEEEFWEMCETNDEVEKALEEK